jgi:hypothetical protein
VRVGHRTRCGRGGLVSDLEQQANRGSSSQFETSEVPGVGAWLDVRFPRHSGASSWDDAIRDKQEVDRTV